MQVIAGGGGPASTTTTTTTTTTSTTTSSTTSTTTPPETSTLPPTTIAEPTTPAPQPTSTTATTSPAPPGGQFTADFSSPADLDRFDWQVFHGGIDVLSRGPEQPRSWHGDHDMSCGAPTTQRDVHLHGGRPVPVRPEHTANWSGKLRPVPTRAKGHVMTSKSTAAVGYARVDFSPRQTLQQRVPGVLGPELDRPGWAQVDAGVGRARERCCPGATVAASTTCCQFRQADVAVNGERLAGDAFMLGDAERHDAGVRVGQASSRPGRLQRVQGPPTRRAGSVNASVDAGGSACASSSSDRTAPRYERSPAQPCPTGPVRVLFQDVTYDELQGAPSPQRKRYGPTRGTGTTSRSLERPANLSCGRVEFVGTMTVFWVVIGTNSGGTSSEASIVPPRGSSDANGIWAR